MKYLISGCLKNKIMWCVSNRVGNKLPILRLLENTMTLGVAAVTAGRGVKSGNKATTEKTV